MITSKNTALAPWIALLAAAGTFALTMGARQSMGLFMSPLHTSTGLGMGSISLAFAFGQLWWGLTQPFAGAVADKVGAAPVLFVGIVLVAVGTFVTPLMTTSAGLILAIGVLAAGGAGMAGPAVLMATTTRMVPTEWRGIATGVVNAGGSFGQFVMAPIAGALVLGVGWVNAMQVMGLLVLLCLPAILVLRGAPAHATTESAQRSLGAGEAIRTALSDRNFLMLSAGFFVCGFHVAFLATHLPGIVASCGLPVQFGAWALAVLGLFNIVGSIATGWAVGRWRMKSLLSLIYAIRAVAVLLFLLSQKTGPAVLAFAAVMGATFLSTVPPTAGLVAKFYGVTHMATLFGLIMVTHQVGGFLGALIGGQVFEATGSYDPVWYVDICLALGAALIHLPIREARLPERLALA